MNNPKEIVLEKTQKVTYKFDVGGGDYTQVYHGGLMDYLCGLSHAESFKIFFWLMPDITMDNVRTLTAESICKRTISKRKSDYKRYKEWSENKIGVSKGFSMYVKYIDELIDNKLIISPQSNGEYIANPFIFWQGETKERYKISKMLDIKGDFTIYIPPAPKEISIQKKQMLAIEKGVVFICQNKNCGGSSNTKKCIARTKSNRTVLGVFCPYCGARQESFDIKGIGNTEVKYLER